MHLPGPSYLLVAGVVLVAGAGFVWRFLTGRLAFALSNERGIPIALGCWFVGATLSVILNWHTPQVLVTYCSVFVVGALVFGALYRVSLSPASLDVAIAGLALGAMVPLVAGLLAFAAEWGMPDLPTALSAYRDVLRMALYEAATFGNRGNTAAFLVLLTPVITLTVIDARKRLVLRLVCALTLALVVANLAILQVRAAFVALALALVCVWMFRLGVRRLPLLVASVAIAWASITAVDPDFGWRLRGEMVPVLIVDTESDASVEQRVQAIQEGWRIFERNWLLGIGPGASSSRHQQDSAHQFQVQQAMETGVLGLVGSTLFSLYVLIGLARSLVRRRAEIDDLRFALLIGPAAYIAYAVLANATLGFGTVNVWTVLTASMVALTPPFRDQVRATAPDGGI